MFISCPSTAARPRGDGTHSRRHNAVAHLFEMNDHKLVCSVLEGDLVKRSGVNHQTFRESGVQSIEGEGLAGRGQRGGTEQKGITYVQVGGKYSAIPTCTT